MTSKQLGDFDVFNFGKEFPFAIGFDRTLQLLERANQHRLMQTIHLTIL